MKSSIKSIGAILMSISLLWITSGCGKKLMSGSSGSDRKVAQASVKPVVLTEKMSDFQPLAVLDETQLSQENGLGVGNSASGSQSNQNSIVRGRTDSVVDDSLAGLKKDSGFQDMLTKPRQEVRAGSSSESNRKGVTFSNGLQDVYFEFDSWRLTEKYRQVLEANAEWLKANPHERITIEGHCDERGTQAYNYVLGEKRATMVQQYLGFLGVSYHQLAVTSFGKEKPKCHTYSENCFRQNRRAHFDPDLNLASQ